MSRVTLVYVDTGRHRLWVTEKGSGPPVVLLHSLFFDHRVFSEIESTLADGHRVIAVDLPGHGHSEGPPGRFSLWDAAGAVNRVLEELDAAPAHVVGLSMGGMIALRMAIAHPENVTSLGLLGTSAGEEEREWLHKAMAGIVRLTGRPATHLLMPYVVDQMFSEHAQQTPAAKTWADRVASMDPTSIYEAGMAVFDRESLVDRLDEVNVPVLVLRGEKDEAIPRQHALDMVEGLPDAELVELENAGHIVTVEQPDEVAHQLVHFLRRAMAKGVDTD